MLGPGCTGAGSHPALPHGTLGNSCTLLGPWVLPPKKAGNGDSLRGVLRGGGTCQTPSGARSEGTFPVLTQPHARHCPCT